MIKSKNGYPTAEELIEKVREVGYCLIEDIIPEDKIELIKKEISDAAHANCSDYASDNITHMSGTINHTQIFAEYVAHPRIMALVDTFFGPYARVSSTTTTINEPGNKRGMWHSDWPFNQRNAGHIPVPYPDIMLHITSIWMLSAFSKENGGTLIRPGSHKLDYNPSVDYPVNKAKTDDKEAMAKGWTEVACDPLDDEINATGPAGSVLFFDSRLWHATAPNTSSDPRVALIVRYAPWWINLKSWRPGSIDRKIISEEPGIFENVLAPLPIDVYNRLPEVTKPLFRHWVEENA